MALWGVDCLGCSQIVWQVFASVLAQQYSSISYTSQAVNEKIYTLIFQEFPTRFLAIALMQGFQKNSDEIKRTNPKCLRNLEFFIFFYNQSLMGFNF